MIFEQLFCILLYFSVPSDQQVDGFFACSCLRVFSRQKTEAAWSQRLLQNSKLFEKKILKVPGMEVRERRPLRAAAQNRWLWWQEAEWEGFEGDEREGGRERGDEMWKDHEGVGLADLERLVRYRGSQLQPKLPKWHPKAEELLALEVHMGGEDGVLWGPGRANHWGRDFPVLWWWRRLGHCTTPCFRWAWSWLCWNSTTPVGWDLRVGLRCFKIKITYSAHWSNRIWY